MSIHKYSTKRDGTHYRVMWRDAAGKQRSKSVATLAEARRIDASVKLGTPPPEPVPANVQTLNDWFYDWFRFYSREWSPTTIKQRKSLYDRWIRDQIGSEPLATIRKRTILEYRERMINEGATNKTVNSAISVVSAALTAAVNEDRIEHNPCREMRRLKTEPTSRRALTTLEVEAIRDAMSTPRDKIVVSLLAYAGLRPAELLGLQWKHVRDNVIIVEQSAQDGTIVSTKTGKTRSVPICAELAIDIAAYGRGDADTFVVTGERGGILHWKNWFRRVWMPAAAAAGVNARPYDLRHTFASLMLHSGATIPETSAALGHANPVMTLNTYSHVYAEAQGSTRLSLDEAIRAARTQRAAKGRAAGGAAA